MIARVTPLLILVLSADVSGQDLLDRSKKKDKPTVEKTFSQDRIELHASAPLLSKEARNGGLRVGLQARGKSSFVCGNFDSFAGIKDLVTEDLSSRGSRLLLDVAEGELVGNGMTLLCQASPTLCDVLKHYRFSAQALLQINYDKCRAIDRALESGKSSLQAEALKGCLARKQDQGVSLPRALKECEQEGQKQGFNDLNGQFVQSIDLNKEFESLFGRTPSWDDLSSITLTPGGVKGELKVNPVEPEYLKRRDYYAKEWKNALDKHLAGQRISNEALSALTPSWVRYRIGRQDLAALAGMNPSQRALLLDQLATDYALLDLARQVSDLDQKLAIAAAKADQSAGTPVELARQWRKQRQHLKRSLQELLSTRRLVNLANASYKDFLNGMNRSNVNTARSTISALGQIQEQVKDAGIGRGMYPVHSTSTKPGPGEKTPDLLKRVAKAKHPAPPARKSKSDEPCCGISTFSWGE